jgi:uncharacterized cupin superfamily protein
MTQKVTVGKADYPDWPLQTLGAVIVEGDPRGSGKVTFQTSDKLVSGGVWECTAGTFDLTFGWDEMAYLLQGELVIQEDSGKQIRVQPGDFFFSSKGSRARWIVKQPIKKVFFLRTPDPLG